MKKFAAVALFAFVSLAFSFGVDDTAVITGSVAQHLSVAVTDLALAEINYTSGATGDIAITARANVKSWKLSATATYGKLTWGGEETWDPADADEDAQIGYTVALKSGATVLFPAAALTKATETTLSTFARKTTGGAGGEAFTLAVTVAAPAGNDDWVYGVYKEEIKIIVTAL